MKKTYIGLFTLAATMLTPMISIAQNETPDTVLNLKAKSKIIITENGDEVAIKISGEENGDKFSSSIITRIGSDSHMSTRQSTQLKNVNEIIQEGPTTVISGGWSAFMSGICLGLTNSSGQGNPGGLQWSKSIEICWMNAFGIRYTYRNGLSISAGIGFNWRNYKTTLQDRFIDVTKYGSLLMSEPSDGNKIRFSRLKTFAVQFPLLFGKKFPNTNLRFKIGPIMNITSYSSVKTSYNDNDGNHTYFNKDLDTRKVTFDLFGNMAYRSFGIYLRYSPSKVMNNSEFNFTPMTVGFTIGI